VLPRSLRAPLCRCDPARPPTLPTLVRWYKPPRNDGIDVHVTKGGTVDRIWAVNDERFTTPKNLHIGSTDAEVRAALSAPSNVAVDDAGKTKPRYYREPGLWFYI